MTRPAPPDPSSPPDAPVSRGGGLGAAHSSSPPDAPASFGVLGAPATTTPLAAGRLDVWLGLLRANGGRVDGPFALRALFATASSAALAPLRLVHRLRLGGVLARGGAVDDPILIVGHYRSGTTHLQNLLTRDPQWALVTTAQALAPELSLAPGPWKRALAALLPATRAMDEMVMGIDLPEEPDHALAALSRFSFYHGFAFPSTFTRHYREYVALEDAPAGRIAAWSRLYREQLRLACALSERPRAVIKNPADTARLGHVLGVFPEAAFVHVVRDPRTMFFSIRNFYRKTLEEFSMQRWSEDDVEALVWGVYEHMMRAYLRERGMVPPGSLCEVRFETLEERPMEVLEEIYRVLGLSGFADAAPHFERYLDEKRDYRKNAYRMDPETVARIEDRWGFALDAWGYR